MNTEATPPPNEGWVPSGTCGGRWSRVRDGFFETWGPQPTPGVTIAGGGAIYTTTPSDTRPSPAQMEIQQLRSARAALARVEAVCVTGTRVATERMVSGSVVHVAAKDAIDTFAKAIRAVLEPTPIVHLGDSGAYCRPCAGCDEVTQACRDAGCGAEVNIDFDVLNAKIHTDGEIAERDAALARVRALALEWVHLGATLEDHADTMPGPRRRTVARSQMAMDHGWAILKALDTKS